VADNFGQIKVNDVSSKRLDALLKETMKVHNAELPKVIKNGARDLVFELVKATPIARGKSHGKGFARACWGVAIVGLGKRPGAYYFAPSANRPVTWTKFGEFIDNLSKKGAPSVTMVNAAPFIEEMDGSSAIIPQAMYNATNKIEKRLSDHSKRVVRKWK
jgi:hypothetical protein